MISSRCTNVSPPVVMIRPPLGLLTKAATARSISPASRTSIGFNSTPNDGATAWMAPSWPLPETCLESRNTATRVRPGAISLSNSNHFPLMPYSVKLNPVALPPGRARLSTKPPPTGSATFTNAIGTARVASSKGGAAGCENDVGRECDQFGCIFANLFGAGRPARVDAHIMAVDPAQFPQPAQERRDAGSAFRIVRGGAHEHADTSHLVGLLRARRERPRGRRAAECDQQFPPSDGDCHTPLPCEVRKGNDTTPRACCPSAYGPGGASCFQRVFLAAP